MEDLDALLRSFFGGGVLLVFRYPVAGSAGGPDPAELDRWADDGGRA